MTNFVMMRTGVGSRHGSNRTGAQQNNNQRFRGYTGRVSTTMTGIHHSSTVLVCVFGVKG